MEWTAVSVIVSLVALLISAVWGVAKIKSHGETAISKIETISERMTEAMNGLRDELTKLDQRMEAQNKHNLDVVGRIASVEGKLDILATQKQNNNGANRR